MQPDVVVVVDARIIGLPLNLFVMSPPSLLARAAAFAAFATPVYGAAMIAFPQADLPGAGALARLVNYQRRKTWQSGINRPRRIILMRHGQTHGYPHTCSCKVDGKNACYQRPETQRPLTDVGIDQSCEAGVRLKALLSNSSGDGDDCDGACESVRFYVSPFKAAKQTFEYMAASLPQATVSVIEEPRIRNLDKGDWWQTMTPETLLKQKQLAARQGSFYFRWAGGESGADVYDRLSQMIASLYREWEQPARAQNYVLLTHDMTIRVFLMRWFRWDVETFHRLRKLKTGQFVVMERQDDGAYKLTAPIPSFSPGPPSRNFVEGTVGKGWRATLKPTPSMIQDDPRLAVIPWGSVDEKIQEAEAKKKQKGLDPAVERK